MMPPACPHLTNDFLVSLELNLTPFSMCSWPPGPMINHSLPFLLHSTHLALFICFSNRTLNFIFRPYTYYSLCLILTFLALQYHGSLSSNAPFSGWPLMITHFSVTTCDILLCIVFVALSVIWNCEHPIIYTQWDYLCRHLTKSDLNFYHWILTLLV